MFDERETPVMEMPGVVVAMTAKDDLLYVICRVKRRWWQFWRPEEYTTTVTIAADQFVKA